MPRKRSASSARSAPARVPTVADLPSLLTIDEFMEVTRIGRSSAYTMARDGTIPIVRIGRHIRIPRDVLEQREQRA